MKQRLKKNKPAVFGVPPNGAGEARWRSPSLICLLLALATLLAYASVGSNDFVNYDDPDYVSTNPHVQAGLSLANIKWAFTTGHASNWHPLTWLSHMLDCQVFGSRPSPLHLVNLAFHIANTALLFLLLRSLTCAHWRSAMVAGLFALHPLHVESVAWISERKDVLSTLFFLLTLGAYARYVALSPRAGGRGAGAKEGATELRSGRSTPDARRSVLAYRLALVFFALGLMSKPMLVTVPFVLLLLDYWPLKRFSLPQFAHASGITHHVSPPSPRTAQLLPVLLEKLPFLALSVASCAVTFIAQERGGAVSTVLPLRERIANALVSCVRYLGKTFWPVDLSVLYLHPGHWPLWQVVLAAFIVGALSGAAVWQIRARPWLVVGWFWFLGTLVPVIGLVQVGIQAMADRYTYIPLIGLCIALVWGLAELLPAQPDRRKALAAISLVSLVVCAGLTIRQVQFWYDSGTLFRRAIQVDPNNYLAYNNLGHYLSGKGRAAEAMANYTKALEINPLYDEALNNVGYALAGQRRFQEAIDYYERALRIRPNQVEVHNNLGNALSELGKLNEAIEQYHIALGLNSEHADAHNNLGIALAMQGKLDEAIPHFRDAIRFKPAYANAHSNLGNALAVQHKLDEATKEYEIALKLNPNEPQVYNNLGNVLSEQGRLDDAISRYTKAIELNSNNPEAQCNLGLALARQGKRAEAAAPFSEALRLRPDYAEARRQLDALTR